jgi:hypothetical protein
MTKKALLQNSYHFPTKMGSSIIWDTLHNVWSIQHNYRVMVGKI